MLTKVNVKYPGGMLEGPNGPFCPVIQNDVFYLDDAALGEVIARFATNPDVKVEVLPYHPTPAAAVIAIVETGINAYADATVRWQRLRKERETA